MMLLISSIALASFASCSVFGKIFLFPIRYRQEYGYNDSRKHLQQIRIQTQENNGLIYKIIDYAAQVQLMVRLFDSQKAIDLSQTIRVSSYAEIPCNTAVNVVSAMITCFACILRSLPGSLTLTEKFFMFCHFYQVLRESYNH